jgi:hypothetical protein
MPQHIRNPATTEQIEAFGNTLGVVFTKPMRAGTLQKLQRLAASDSESQDDRMAFWKQVSVYTDESTEQLYLGTT